jgi:hypothetical protein
VITVSGETLSLASGGSSVVIVSGGQTQTLGLGGIIASVGGFTTSTDSPAGNYSGPAASGATLRSLFGARLMETLCGMVCLLVNIG